MIGNKQKTLLFDFLKTGDGKPEQLDEKNIKKPRAGRKDTFSSDGWYDGGEGAKWPYNPKSK